MKKIFLKVLSLIFIFILLSPAVSVHAEKEDEQSIIMGEQLKSDEIKQIERTIEKHKPEDIEKIFPDFNPENIIKQAATGNLKPEIIPFFQRILNFLLSEIYLNLNIMVKLLVVVVFCAVLKNLQTSFLSESVGELAFYACYTVIVAIMVLSLDTTMKLGKDIIDNMVAFMHSSIPILVTLMISGGNVATGGILQPLLIMSIEVVASIFKNFLLPMVMLNAVLSIVSNITDKVQITRITGFVKSITNWCLGIIMTVFIAIVSLQGTLGAVVDGVASKTAKFAISTFVPVAGKYLADAADTVLGCTLLIKNGAGVVVMIGILSICILPLLKLASIIVIFRMTSALVEPITEKRITNAMNDIASSMTYILGIAAAVAFMFLLSVTALISASTLSAMMR